MKKILVIGSLNMDITMRMERVPETGETLAADSMVTSPGGKGANQAYAVGKLGGDVSMLGAVGQDTYGKELLDNLASVGVDVSCIQQIANVPTGMAVIYVEHTGANRIVLMAGANSMVDRSYIDAHMDKIVESDIVILQFEIPLDTVVYAAEMAKKFGKTVILDPAPALSGIPKKLWTYVDYIKPNETELNIILTGKTDGLPLNEALIQVQKLGVKNVWVTMGSRGVFFRDENGREETIPSIKVKAVDTTAAGDTFLAAAAVSLSQGKSTNAAISYGNRAAAVAVTREGAQQSVPTEEEIEQFFAKRK